MSANRERVYTKDGTRRNKWQTEAVSFAECFDCNWSSGQTPASLVAARAIDHARRKQHRTVTHRTVEYDFRVPTAKAGA